MTTDNSPRRDISNRKNRQDLGVNNPGCLKMLRELGYTAIPNSSSKAIPDIVVDVLNRFGNMPSNRMMMNLRMLVDLSEKDLCTGYEQLASNISSVFGSVGASVVLESIKQELQHYLLAKTATNDLANAYLIRMETKRTLKELLCHIGKNVSIQPNYAASGINDMFGNDSRSLEVKARATINEIIEKIRILDTFESISKLKNEHVLLLYGNEGSKDSILATILQGTLTSADNHESSIERCSSMLSTSWLIEKGFVDEIISLEESLNEIEDIDTQEIKLYRNSHSGTSIVCAYNISNIGKDELAKVIESHRYVILDEPFTLYKKEK